MTTDMQETSDTAQLADAEALEKQSSEILARARYEAFGLVTEARKEAESIIDDAKSEAAEIVREAEMTAESIRDAARINASETRAASAIEIDPEKQAAVEQLEAEHAELTERVGSLREIADQLEQRFAALVETTPTPTTDVAETEDVSTAPVLDYQPSVPLAEPVDQHAEKADQPAKGEKGSFYSRRSAKLPSIGESAGKSALDMMRSIRATIDDG